MVAKITDIDPTKDEIPDTNALVDILLSSEKHRISIPGNSKEFSEDYKYTCFLIWYKNGKPSVTTLERLLVPDPISGHKYTRSTLNHFIVEDWRPFAEELDRSVKAEISRQAVQEKVEMLNRHAKVAKEMQDMAIEYLRENEDEITVPTAIKLLISGIEIERNSRGIPQALENMVNASDEELMSELKNLLVSGDANLDDKETTISDSEVIED